MPKPADEWNARHPVGTPVRAYPGIRPEDGPDAEQLDTRTRSKAETLGGHTPVVWVDGHDSCIALSHVDPIDQTEKDDGRPRIDLVSVTRALANTNRAVAQFAEALHPAMQRFAANLAQIHEEMREAGLIDEHGRLRHATRGTNAEDCPACRAAPEPPPYPFLCPGPDTFMES